jgi:hypothetical protein
MAVPVESLVRVNWMGRCFGQRIVLTTGYKKTTGPVALTDEQEMNGIIDDLIVGGGVDLLTDYLACLPPEYAMEEVRAQVIHSTRTTAVQRVIATPGTHASSATVASDSACITLKGAFAGANRRSNKHIGPVPDAASAAGLITNAFTTKLNALGSALVSLVVLGGGETYTPTVWHIDPFNAATTHTLNQWTVGTTSRVQRRRTVGLGE